MEETKIKSSEKSAVSGTPEFDVVIVGAGFSGVYQLHRLQQLGFSVRLLEAGEELGGIWYWNCYPGARVDTHAPIYGFSHEELWQDWSWKQRFSGWEELRQYFKHVDNKWNLKKDIQFKSRVTAAQFDEKENKWTLRVNNDSSVKARFVVLATGFGAVPYTPKLEGLESFAGPKPHTGFWPQEGLDFTGKRVGVFGTGASGVQVAQEAAKVAKHLTVFQRTPNTAMPMRQVEYDAKTTAEMKKNYPAMFARRRDTFAGFDFGMNPTLGMEVSPEERTRVWDELWNEGGFAFWLGNFSDVFMNKEMSRLTYEYWRDKVRVRIKDPVIAEMLAPTVAFDPFGTKRPSLENGYYDIFNQDNVTLVDMRKTPVTRITPTSVVTASGEHELDILVMATGFDAVTGAITHMNITGAGGATFKEYWKDGLKVQLGLASAGFPNLFFLYGPQSPTAFANGPSSAEFQGEVLVDLLTHLRDKGYTRCESTPQADQAWANLVNDTVQQSLFPMANSWYMGANIPGKKRESLSFTGGLPLYLEKCKESADSGYAGFVLS